MAKKRGWGEEYNNTYFRSRSISMWEMSRMLVCREGKKMGLLCACSF